MHLSSAVMVWPLAARWIIIESLSLEYTLCKFAAYRKVLLLNSSQQRMS